MTKNSRSEYRNPWGKMPPSPAPSSTAGRAGGDRDIHVRSGLAGDVIVSNRAKNDAHTLSGEDT